MERYFESTPFAGETFFPASISDETFYSDISFQALLAVKQDDHFSCSVMPKLEPMINDELINATDPLSDSIFHHLPDLHCFDQTELSMKRLKSSPSPAVMSPDVAASRALARHRRQKISEKTRCLQKLLPLDKKMDTATMLEEAYKYIKFLQAQVSVLQSMPCQSSSEFSNGNPRNVDNVFGDLGNLSRQELLQVVVNSPEVQAIMYSQGSCVYSIEQVKQIAEKKDLYEQMALESDSSMLTI